MIDLTDMRKLSRREIIIEVIALIAFCAIWPVLTVMIMVAM